MNATVTAFGLGPVPGVVAPTTATAQPAATAGGAESNSFWRSSAFGLLLLLALLVYFDGRLLPRD